MPEIVLKNRYAIWFGEGMATQVVASNIQEARDAAQAFLEATHGFLGSFVLSGMRDGGSETHDLMPVYYEQYALDRYPNRMLPLDAVELIEEDVTP